MRLPLIVASIICSLVYTGTANAAPLKKPVSSRKLGLTIKVEGDGWGNARKETIESVLYSVADELLTQLPKKLTVPIVVTHTDSNPIALFEQGPNGEYRVQLHASGENWHLYTYEFAHELCHILSNYEANRTPGNSKYNQWFEETLCETASLFTLKNLAVTWENQSPAPQWARQPEKLRRFFDLLISEGHRQLPPHSPLTTWLDNNEERLRHDPYLRQKNEVVANLLLPLFDRDPENWATLSYLNLDPSDARSSLREYLHHWYQNAPAAHKAFIADVLGLFGVQTVIASGSTDETTIVASTGGQETAAVANSELPDKRP
jgi:hypothetical protein